ncbi:MAG: hypothetical protein A2934_04575 [Candidatus Sungbacteria bacterium RIFCSPLOWO2_01_FULL_47_10]|uniref:Uncharacterized protein n=1 Tax=Candidatus Sungbacteria bacterium RIFCSPLOWO2_01_FULL_47_10 TaxID=1802276 RepID=A0A1G2L6U7_9BACT|nr:MAG: hypothetical protein A2934_04575 [Candidatus Sungbacteria bacterium RIFCSPLOWO2_01_FULL_47_10]
MRELKVFSGTAFGRLEDSPIEKVFVTDSIFHPRMKFFRIRRLLRSRSRTFWEKRFYGFTAKNP